MRFTECYKKCGVLDMILFCFSHPSQASAHAIRCLWVPIGLSVLEAVKRSSQKLTNLIKLFKITLIRCIFNMNNIMLADGPAPSSPGHLNERCSLRVDQLFTTCIYDISQDTSVPLITGLKY